MLEGRTRVNGVGPQWIRSAALRVWCGWVRPGILKGWRCTLRMRTRYGAFPVHVHLQLRCYDRVFPRLRGTVRTSRSRTVRNDTRQERVSHSVGWSSSRRAWFRDARRLQRMIRHATSCRRSLRLRRCTVLQAFHFLPGSTVHPLEPVGDPFDVAELGKTFKRAKPSKIGVYSQPRLGC